MKLEGSDRPIFLPSGYEVYNEFVANGSQGAVLQGKDDQGESIGIKRVPLIEQQYKLKQLLREIKIQKHLDHPNILKIKKIIVSPNEDEIYLIFDFCLNDLTKVIKDNVLSNNNEVILDYIFNILLAVDYMHKKGVMHRDLKPNNILINKND